MFNVCYDLYMSSFVMFFIGFVCGFCFTGICFMLRNISDSKIIGKQMKIEIENPKGYYSGKIKLSEIKEESKNANNFRRY